MMVKTQQKTWIGSDMRALGVTLNMTAQQAVFLESQGVVVAVNTVPSHNSISSRSHTIKYNNGGQ